MSYLVVEMNRGVCFTVVLLTFGFAPLVIAGPVWSKEFAETQGFKDFLKAVGSKRTYVVGCLNITFELTLLFLFLCYHQHPCARLPMMIATQML